MTVKTGDWGQGQWSNKSINRSSTTRVSIVLFNDAGWGDIGRRGPQASSQRSHKEMEMEEENVLYFNMILFWLHSLCLC